MDMTEITLNVVRAALEKGGQHIMIAPDGGVSIWPDECANLTHCKDCKHWDNTSEGRYVGGWCFCEKLQFSTSSKFFCADGEERGEDE